MEMTRKVCPQKVARGNSQKALNTMLRVNLKDDRRATKSVYTWGNRQKSWHSTIILVREHPAAGIKDGGKEPG